MKDGTVKNLDCDIQVHVEAFSKDLNVNYASNYKAIREKSSFDTNRGGFTFSNIGEDMKTFDMKDLVYDDTKMEATYDTQTDELILDGKEPLPMFVITKHILHKFILYLDISILANFKR